jgi:hypothetical protein
MLFGTYPYDAMPPCGSAFRATVGLKADLQGLRISSNMSANSIAQDCQIGYFLCEMGLVHVLTT